MKSPLFAILLISTTFRATAQPMACDSSGSFLSNFRSITIKLEDPRKRHTGYCPFQHFEILDERPDTTRIGVHTWNAFIGKGNRQLMLGKPASRELSDYMDEHIACKTSSYTALIVIRALWLSDGTYTLAEISKDTGIAEIKTKIRLKAEVYAEKAGVYTPIFRFDSTRLSRRHSYFMVGRDLAGMLNILTDSASILLEKLGNSGRQLSLNDISHFNQSRFNPAISSDSIILVRGVYRNFQEFKDNAPSIQNFETAKGKDRLLLYIKQVDGTSYYSHDAWGYCDGKSIYVMKDGMLVPAWKEGKAFYLLGRPEEYGAGKFDPSHDQSAVTPVKSMPLAYRDAALRHLFTVDMDTGKLY